MNLESFLCELADVLGHVRKSDGAPLHLELDHALELVRELRDERDEALAMGNPPALPGQGELPTNLERDLRNEILDGATWLPERRAQCHRCQAAFDTTARATLILVPEVSGFDTSVYLCGECRRVFYEWMRQNPGRSLPQS